jgi:hypothetical protein
MSRILRQVIAGDDLATQLHRVKDRRHLESCPAEDQQCGAIGNATTHALNLI